MAETRETIIPDDIRRYLDAARHATISTISADGWPHQAVTWYLLTGDRLLLNSRRGRRWPANLERDPRISVAVPDVEHLGHWVGLRGRATFLRDGLAALEDIRGFAKRYGGDPDRYADQERVTFSVQIERTYEYWS